MFLQYQTVDNLQITFSKYFLFTPLHFIQNAVNNICKRIKKMTSRSIIDKLELFSLKYQYPLKKLFVFDLKNDHDEILLNINLANRNNKTMDIRSELNELANTHYILDFTLQPQFLTFIGYFNILTFYTDKLNEDMPTTNIDYKLIDQIYKLIK